MIAQVLRRSPRSDLLIDQTINDFQSETAEITGACDPLAARSLLHVLAIMVISAIVLAGIVKIDRVVSGNARVVSEQPTLVVQPLETSIVRGIEVREGQMVRKGDILATLDPTFSSADVGSLRAQTARLTAEITRLEAEQNDAAFEAADTSPDSVMQLSIWRSRQAEYASKMLGYKQKLESDIATIAHARQDVELYRSRLDLVRQVEGMRKELEARQAGSRLNSLIATDNRIEISRNMAQAENAIQTATHDMEVLQADREVFVQQWKSAIAKDLVDRRAEFDKTREELTKAQKRQELVSLRAEADSVVLEVGRFSVGSVVQPGERLISLVPVKSGLFVEADLDASDQGFVAPGQEVDLKFQAYRYIDHGIGHGTVRTISADSFASRDDSKAQTQNRFYRARIDVTDLSLRNVPADFALVPGMTVTADIVVGKRSIMAYLLQGALRNFSEGMREP
jgi:hemolysin D